MARQGRKSAWVRSPPAGFGPPALRQLPPLWSRAAIQSKARDVARLRPPHLTRTSPRGRSSRRAGAPSASNPVRPARAPESDSRPMQPLGAPGVYPSPVGHEVGGGSPKSRVDSAIPRSPTSAESGGFQLVPPSVSALARPLGTRPWRPATLAAAPTVDRGRPRRRPESRRREGRDRGGAAQVVRFGSGSNDRSAQFLGLRACSRAARSSGSR